MASLNEMMEELEAAVRVRDRARALELSQQIERCLVEASQEHAALERYMRALMAELDIAKTNQADPAVLREMHISFSRSRRRSSLSKSIERHEALKNPSVPTVINQVYPVWFGTNRKPDGRGGFTGERHDRTSRGRVDVRVPEAHRFGEIGSNFWKKLVRLDFRDDRLRVEKVSELERDAFYADIARTMQDARADGETPHALFFLHGYHVTFEQAAIRAAQLGVDLKVPGATAFFSWPSRGLATAYPADGATIEASERAITEFLVEFSAHCGAEKIHIVAHSMGNRGLLRALQRIAADAETRGKLRFGQVFLAAPDVDRDLFLDLARLYPEHAERATLYASDADLPVHLSAKLHDAPRAGYFRPYTVAPGIDTIAVPDFDLDLLGHSYFAQAEALLHDMYSLMRHNAAPGQRQRLDAVTEDGLSFWRLRR